MQRTFNYFYFMQILSDKNLKMSMIMCIDLGHWALWQTTINSNIINMKNKKCKIKTLKKNQSICLFNINIIMYNRISFWFYWFGTNIKSNIITLIFPSSFRIHFQGPLCSFFLLFSNKIKLFYTIHTHIHTLFFFYLMRFGMNKK